MLRPCRSSEGHNTARPSLDGRAVGLRRTAWSEHGMASVKQTRPHCVNQMGKTHSKPLAARHGRGILCVNRPLKAYLMSAHVTTFPIPREFLRTNPLNV